MADRTLPLDDDARARTGDRASPDDRALDALYDDAGAAPDDWVAIRRMIGAARVSGFDEEPPPRIDALLMAAARRHAPRPAAPWWARLADWMRPALAHPAFAGAAALVIVGGAAGVMYRRGQHHAINPIAHVASGRGSGAGAAPDRRERPALPPALAPALGSGVVPDEVMQPELPARPSETRTLATEGRGRAPGSGSAGSGSGSAAPGPIGGLRLDDGAPDPTLAIADDGDEEPVGDPVKIGESANGGREQGAGDHATLTDELADKNKLEAEGTSVVRKPVGTAASDDRAAPKPPPPPPPPPRDVVTVAEQQVTTGTTASVESDRRQAQARSQATQLLGQARTAARANNCAVVKVIAKRVRSLDATYYRDVFARDPDLTRCL